MHPISIISCSNLRAGLYVCMPKCTYVMYLCIYVQILETQLDVWQKKDMRPLLKTQNYPRIITSKYTQKMYIKPTKKTKICNSAPFFCFLVVSMAFHTLFFSHPKKKQRQPRQYDIRSRDLVCYLLFGIIIAPFQVPTGGFHDFWVIQVNGYSIYKGV